MTPKGTVVLPTLCNVLAEENEAKHEQQATLNNQIPTELICKGETSVI